MIEYTHPTTILLIGTMIIGFILAAITDPNKDKSQKEKTTFADLIEFAGGPISETTK